MRLNFMEIKKGKAFKFGDDISTDHIAPGRLFHLRSNLEEFSKHVLEDADPTFASTMQKGDFVVAGNNFGLGSSREHAPQIIKIAGVGAVLAKSFARIFYRNAINIGFPILECPEAAEKINDGDTVTVDFETGVITDETTGETFQAVAFPPFIAKIIEKGGLFEYIKSKAE